MVADANHLGSPLGNLQVGYMKLTSVNDALWILDWQHENYSKILTGPPAGKKEESFTHSCIVLAEVDSRVA
jgi:hypothetical protein